MSWQVYDKGERQKWYCVYAPKSLEWQYFFKSLHSGQVVHTLGAWFVFCSDLTSSCSSFTFSSETGLTTNFVFVVVFAGSLAAEEELACGI